MHSRGAQLTVALVILGVLAAGCAKRPATAEACIGARADRRCVNDTRKHDSRPGTVVE